MAKGAALSEGSTGENIQHFAALRIRMTGAGNLRLAVHSLDNIRTKTLVPLVMNTATRIIPTRLVNFSEQRAQFEIKTTDIGEYFKINRIVVYMKEMYTSYPGS